MKVPWGWGIHYLLPSGGREWFVSRKSGKFVIKEGFSSPWYGVCCFLFYFVFDFAFDLISLIGLHLVRYHHCGNGDVYTAMVLVITVIAMLFVFTREKGKKDLIFE